jgi:hypothetical protein
VDRSIPECPAPMAARPKFKKIRFPMIVNSDELCDWVQDHVADLKT